jgi:dihydrodipicolinate reductase
MTSRKPTVVQDVLESLCRNFSLGIVLWKYLARAEGNKLSTSMDNKLVEV